LLALALALAAACGGPSVEIDDTRSDEEQAREPAPLNDVVFVDAQMFAQMRDAGALVLDARSESDYLAGHIPGAVHADEKVLFKDGQGMITADIVELQDRARSVGLENDTPVLIYGSGRSSKTARLFWSLEYLGHGEVHLYLDPYETLLAELGEDASTEPTTKEGDFVVALRPSIYASATEVLEAVNGERDAILIDTRRLTEYEGTEDRGDPRQGFIPGATYYYWEDVLDENDRLRGRDELLAEFQANSMWNTDALIIPYCQTGTRSATVYAVFRWLGHPSVKNYDGSWVEWSRDESFPVATPE
ncbi:MAG: rhodanese-like domain-containing protein, partial [Myxococcota bacterium]